MVLYPTPPPICRLHICFHNDCINACLSLSDGSQVTKFKCCWKRFITQQHCRLRLLQLGKSERCIQRSSWSVLGRQSTAEVTICNSFTLLSVPVGKLMEMMEWKNKMSQQKGVSWKFKHFLISHNPAESKWNQSTNEPSLYWIKGSSLQFFFPSWKIN